MFLTDKGKELMMKQNNFGLSELITRFTLYDEDFDYRTTSKFWWNGVSPVPQFATPPGSDQLLINNGYPPQFPDHINPKWQNPTTGETNYYSSTDVRGHRGHNVLSCFPELETVNIENCTNVYSFYDVTSVSLAAAERAKASLDAWATGYSQTNSGWTGMVFHIPVFGERWVLSSYYPWNGELDVLSYDIAAKIAGGPPWPPNDLDECFDPIPGSITTYDDGTTIIPVDNPGEPDDKCYYGVTGLFNGVETNSTPPYPATGFSVLPPGTLVVDDGMGTIIDGPTIPGSKLEWWVTGCTTTSKKVSVCKPLTSTGYINALTATTCVHTGLVSDTCQGMGTGYTSSGAIYPFVCTGTSWSSSLSGMTQPVIDWPNSALPPLTNTGPGCPTFKIGAALNGGFTVKSDAYHSYATKELDPNQCEQNCCADDVAITGSIFGCKDCNPHKNSISITSGRTLTYTLTKLNGGACNETNKLHSWSVRKNVSCWQTPCDRFKGGDRNVMIINNTDETRDKNGLFGNGGGNMGGIFPLGEKSYYGRGAVTVNNPSTNTPAGTWGPAFGQRGYQGPMANNASIDSNITNQTQQENIMGWSELSDPNDILQPSRDWQYSQDLHCRTLPFYNTFLGFLYPVVKKHDDARAGFLQHSYAAIIGGLVPFAELPNNPTITQGIGGTITNGLQALASDTASGSGVKGQNPYSDLIPVQYSVSQFMLTQGYGPLKTPPWGYTLLGNMNDQMNDSQTNLQITSGLDASWINCVDLAGLKNYGWGMDPEIGCSTFSCAGGQECCPDDMFSPGVYIDSLNRFLSGDTVSQVKTICTYCQCLPTVFINRTGPPGTTIVDPCPNPPCTPPPVVVDQLCGPTPVLGTTINTNFTASNPFAPNKNDY